MKYLSFLAVMMVAQPVLGKHVVYRKTQQVNFAETDVDGQVRTPDGVYLNQRRAVKFLPLYKVKSNFGKKVKESVNYLK